MLFLFLRAYLKLIRFHRCVAYDNFAGLHETVRRFPLRKRLTQGPSVEKICRAVNLACIWYWKEVLCLQRSAATVCLIRSCGRGAQLVIGAQPLPFKAHAWVEIDDRIINDKPYLREIYSVLDCC